MTMKNNVATLPEINRNKKKVIVQMEFFKTKKPNPNFISDERMIKIGECKLDIGKEYEGDKERKIKTIMKFGGTFIDVTAIQVKTGVFVKLI